MKLIPKELTNRLPSLYATEGDSDPMVQCMFFFPCSSWEWYGIEFDGTDIFFGLVNGFEVELGYFSLSELRKTQDSCGMPIERDRSFRPCRLSKLRAMLESRRP